MDIQNISLKKGEQAWSYALAVVGLMVLGGIGYGLFLLMPLLVILAKNTIIFVAELAVLISMLVTAAGIWSERELWHYKWKNYVRRLRRAIVREDPVGIIETALKRFAEKLGLIEEKITEAVAALRVQQSSQKVAIKKRSDAEALYLQAKSQGEPEQVQARHAISADRWLKASEEMQPIIDMMVGTIKGFEQARDIAVNATKDLEDQKQVMKIRQQTAKAGQSAARAFKAFFGKSDESDMAMMGFEELELQINTSEAEIDQFMRVMEPKLKDDKLKNDAEAAQAIARMNGLHSQKQLSAAPVEVLSISKVDTKNEAFIRR